MSKIGVTIFPDTQVEEHKDLALLDDTLQKNWISETLVSILGLQPSSYTDEVSATWRGRTLQSIGAVTFSWSTSNKEIPNSYTTTFHVAQDDSVHLVLGNELLSKVPRIKGSRKGVFILTSSKKGSKGKDPLPSLLVF